MKNNLKNSIFIKNTRSKKYETKNFIFTPLYRARSEKNQHNRLYFTALYISPPCTIVKNRNLAAIFF